MYCLQGLYQKRQYEELGEYLEQISDHLEQIDVSVHVGDEIADAILSEKMARAKQLGILLEVDGEMSGAKMSALDICTIFSNMIESVEKYNGECQLNVMEDENGHYEFQIEMMIPLEGQR
jgi:sensor histidine kinase regulating citrate/malate metabolism